MSATGPARVELLRQALTLDPDNSAVQNMLAGALSSLNAPAAVPVGTDAGSNPAIGQAAVPPTLRPAAARGVHGAAPKGSHDSDLRNNDKAPEPKIRRSIVVE